MTVISHGFPYTDIPSLERALGGGDIPDEIGLINLIYKK